MVETLPGLAGLRKPEAPKIELPPVDRKVMLRVHAGDVLNTDPSARSLSVVVRIYKLKDATAFMTAPRHAFNDAAAEAQAFGGDLVDSREVVLIPGQKYEAVEKVPPAAAYLAVVTRFRAPAEGRWRFVFETGAAERTGVTLGVHGCAMSVAAGNPVGTPRETLRLAGLQCR